MTTSTTSSLTGRQLPDTCTMGRILAALPYNREPKRKSDQMLLDELPTSTASPA